MRRVLADVDVYGRNEDDLEVFLWSLNRLRLRLKGKLSTPPQSDLGVDSQGSLYLKPEKRILYEMHCIPDTEKGEFQMSESQKTEVTIDTRKLEELVSRLETVISGEPTSHQEGAAPTLDNRYLEESLGLISESLKEINAKQNHKRIASLYQMFAMKKAQADGLVAEYRKASSEAVNAERQLFDALGVAYGDDAQSKC